VILQVLLNGGDQFRNAAEYSAADSLIGNLAEPAFDHIQPGTRCWNEVQMKARMSSHPGFYARMLVGRVIVHDQMKVQLGRSFRIDFFEEADEFLMAVSRHAVSDHFSIKHAEGRKQRGCAVAFVIVRHGPAASLFHREPRLGSVEGLNLAFLVDAKDQRLVRGVEVEANDIVELVDKVLVATDLEGFDQMGLESMLFPNTLNACRTDTLCLSHCAYAPMSRRRRLRMLGRFDDGTDFPCRNVGDAAGTRSILFQPCDPQSQEAFPPELDGRPGNSQFSCDVLIGNLLGCQRDDLRALHQTLWETSSMRPGAEDGPFLGRKQDGRGCSHGS